MLCYVPHEKYPIKNIPLWQAFPCKRILHPTHRLSSRSREPTHTMTRIIYLTYRHFQPDSMSVLHLRPRIPPLPGTRFQVACVLEKKTNINQLLCVSHENNHGAVKSGPSMAFGRVLKIFNAPPTIPGQPSLKDSGTASGATSISAHSANKLNFLSCTRGRRASLLIATNHWSKKVRAMPAL